MKRYFKKLLTYALACSICLTTAVSALATGTTSELTTAATYLRENGIMVGDETGNMMLDKGLTRAHLAALLTRIIGNPDHVAAEQDYYSKQCTFTDVPDWAKVYVGYCAANHLVAGYGNGLYGSNDPVTPAAACTVMLRALDDVGTDWTYHTACQTAIDLGLAPEDTLSDNTMTRGGMAILIYRTMAKMGYDITLPAQPPTDNTDSPITRNADGSINVPSDDSRYVPQAGDVIRCDDGSLYEIWDMSRYDSNVFASSPVGELPAPTCNWERFPEPDVPNADVRHFANSTGDTLFIRNLYETRRMQYTIYNALGSEPSAWRGDEPLATLELSIPADLEPYIEAFWPWRASELTDLVHSRPNSRYYVEAWDYYLNGVFQYTRYCVVSQ